MTLRNILVFILLGLVFRLLRHGRWRARLIFAASVLAVYWLQPAMPVRYLDFWLPTLTIFLAVLGWVITSIPQTRFDKANIFTFTFTLLLIVLVGLTRYLEMDGFITAGRPPQTIQIILVLIAFIVVTMVLVYRSRTDKGITITAIGIILGIFILLKYPPMTVAASSVVRQLMQQDASLASASDFRWLGFSYLAFRLLHTFRDRQLGRLPSVNLQEYVIYMVFFPALTAGPIDRLERFVRDLRHTEPLSADEMVEAGKRLTIGLFKKFVLADMLAMIALNPLNAGQVKTTGWMWILLYAYAFQIYLDFSGYTDIALGVGKLAGINLPDNFNKPYLKSNLAHFWNNWHMTLTQWFRTYYFNPLVRLLRRSERRFSPGVVILFSQLSTMLLIGLWHGISWNFVLWGAWHGLGLFVHNRWTEWSKPRLLFLEQSSFLKKVYTALGIAVTFHFVALGWVWFALPQVSLAITVYSVLFGVQ